MKCSSKSSTYSIKILLQELSDSGGEWCEIESFKGYFKLLDFSDKSTFDGAFDTFNLILTTKKVSF